MKIKKITNNKIKIFLSLEDMNLCHISEDLMFSDKYISQHLLQIFLEKAEKELNFTVDDENLLIEVLSLKNGFVFTITRITQELSIENSSLILYEFNDFNDFLAFCTYIKNMNWSVLENFCLFIYKDYCYLITDSILSKEFHMVLSEFGNRYQNSSRFFWFFK